MTALAPPVAAGPEPESRPVTWPGESIAGTLRRMGAILAVTWLAVDAYGVVSTGSAAFRLPWLAVACMTVGIVTGALVAVVPRTPGVVMVAGVGVALIADLVLAIPGPAQGDGFVVYWLPGLIAVSAALMLSERTALRVTWFAAVGCAAVVLGQEIGPRGWSGAITSAVASVCITVCDGLAALLLARALRGVAAAADRAMTDTERERELQARQRAEADAARDLAVRLHDTVINTLAAVVARGDTLEPADVRHHCAEAADLATRIRTSDDSALDDVRHALKWSDRASPLYPAVRLVGLDRHTLFLRLAALPPPVASALAGALHEALTNVSKHSGVGEAVVEVQDRGRLRLVVRDDGTGFGGAVPPGRGLAVSVVERCAAVGVAVRIDTAPGAGTAITLDYDRAAPDDEAEQVRRDRDVLLASVRTPFARQLSYCLFALCACMTVVTAPTQNSAWTWTALGLLGLVTWIGAVQADARGWLGLRWIALITASIPLIVYLPAAGLPGCERFGTAWWGTDGALIAFVCLVFLVRRWRWVAVGALAFAAGVVAVELSGNATGCRAGAYISGVLDFVVVAALAYFRFQLSRVATRASTEAARGRALRAAVAGEGAAMRVRFAEVFVALESASELLRAIADGALDPRHPTTRERCAAVEGRLRRLTQLDPGARILGPYLARALSRAADAGVRLDLRLRPGDLPDEARAAGFAQLLDAVLDRCGHGEEVTVARLGTDGGQVLTVAAPAACSDLPSQVLAQASDSGWNVDVSDLGEQCLVELTAEPRGKGEGWTTAPDAGPAGSPRPVEASG